MFFVLYPIGIVSEAWLAYKVITPSRSRNPAYQYLLWLGLTIYIPGTYISVVRFSLANEIGSILCSFRAYAFSAE